MELVASGNMEDVPLCTTPACSKNHPLFISRSSRILLQELIFGEMCDIVICIKIFCMIVADAFCNYFFPSSFNARSKFIIDY